MMSIFNRIKRGHNSTATDDSIFNGVSDTTVRFSGELLNDFRQTVGRLPAETGGMLACSKDINFIDTWRFDETSKNTRASYTYNVDVMEPQHLSWKSMNIRSTGFIHSHPSGYRQPSYDDIATGLALMKYFNNDVFYLPIVISDRKGHYSLYFFVLRHNGGIINVNLDYVLRATENGYNLIQFRRWNADYSVTELENYYLRSVGQTVVQDYQESSCRMDTKNYFQRLAGFYPDSVLNKVIVVVGNGGARSFVENMARNGFRNFILIDGDKVSPSNIATQGVFVSEMGAWKTEAIRARVLDINPDAKVICVNRFLDDSFSDEEFKKYLDMFHGRKTTDYLVLGCCDTFSGNRRSSELSLKYGLPYIGAGMYEHGLAAEVIFVYPGVTPSCPRCLLRSRYEAYERENYVNKVTSAGCPTFATERLNTLLGFLSLIMLMYKSAPDSPYNRMLDDVKDRNYVWIRMSPFLGASSLGITFFDRVFSSPDVSKYVYMDETLWIPQHPDSPEFGEKRCKLCGGTGDLRILFNKWPDTRNISFIE